MARAHRAPPLSMQRSGEEGRGGVEMHDYVNVPRLKSDKIRHSLPRSLSHSVTRITRQRPRSVTSLPLWILDGRMSVVAA